MFQLIRNTYTTLRHSQQRESGSFYCIKKLSSYVYTERNTYYVIDVRNLYTVRL